ncbi:MAG TPA: phosphotransferase [Candidatus Bathyarchaeia archaeon]|nr:phosphotransferase [Candidatus Bathyarchaeia archaeon]
MAVRLIRQFTDLDPAWVTAALRGSGTLRDAAVAGIGVEPVGVGAGFLGQVARLRLRYDRPEAGAPATIIGKLPTLDPGGREICRMFKFYEREIRFYRELAARVPVRVPRCHASVMDVAEDDYLLLLEDLSGVPIGDDAAGCSATDAERAVRSIARLHRAWWEHAELEGLDWMPLSNAPIHQSAEVAYQQTAEPFLQLFGDHVSPRMRAVTEKLGSHIIAQLDAFTQPPLTVAHGDYRLDNIFFDGTDVAAIDWQITFRGRGVFDVAYFLSGCLAPALRRAEEMRLLRLWHELAAGGGSAYSFDDALLDYRRAVLYGHVYTVIATASLDPANERGTAVFRAWLERRSAAIEDLDAGDLLPA